jgi:bifunctional N-acetylglucosamine-1-phosphate-uridyltransferase/glucosamine-1-phosphate-acetyltransferase GlmU-like protein
VTIGHFSVIHDNVVLEDNVTVGDHCVLGIPTKAQVADRTLRVGAGSCIRSHAAVYEGSQFGVGVQTGHHVMIRESTTLGAYVSIGSFCDLEGDCQLGDCSRCHSYVHIGRGSRIGRFVWLFSLVTLTNDALPPIDTVEPVVICDGAAVLVGCTVFPGTWMEEGSYAVAGTMVRGRVNMGRVVSGPEGADVGHVTTLVHRESRRSLPWMNHLIKRYPEEFHDELRALHDRIRQSRATRYMGSSDV